MAIQSKISPPSVCWRNIIIYYLMVYLISYGLVGAFLLGGGSFLDAS
jgi:hypothetical protein